MIVSRQSPHTNTYEIARILARPVLPALLAVSLTIIGAPSTLLATPVRTDASLLTQQSSQSLILPVADTDGTTVATPDPEAAKSISSAPPEQQRAMIQSMVDGLSAKLEQHPDNYNGWIMLSKSYKVLGQNDKAKATEAKMKKLMAAGVITKPDQKSSSAEKTENAPSSSSTASAPASAAPSTVDGKQAPSDHNDMNMTKMINSLAAKLEKNPNNLQGWALLSNSYKALNQPEKAKAVDEKVKKLIAQGIIKVPLQDQKSAAPTPSQVPSGEAAQAIMNAPPEEQKAMIQGMVDNLAAKLKKNPNDLEGWKRLARSYRVLGEEDKAKEADAHIKDLEAKSDAPAN